MNTLFITVQRLIVIHKPSWAQSLKSAAAAFIGIQSEHNRQADFKQNQFQRFLIAAIISFVIFIVAVLALVNLALS